MIKIIPFDDSRVVGLAVDGDISKDDFLLVKTRCEQAIATHGEARIYCELENLETVSLAAVKEDLTLWLSHFKDFKREAIVCNQEWAEKLIHFTEKLPLPLKVKHFDPGQEKAAREWVTADNE
jgi:hypothetical protein